MQGAIDELYTRVNNKSDKDKIVQAYTYNQTAGSSTLCITGEESTCVKTTCYENNAAESCPSGTIIDYKVNNTETIRFHVIFDEGSKITMQTQKNTVYGKPWNRHEGITADFGPETSLFYLDGETYDWVNVNDQTYTIGTSAESRTSKARMITYEEAVTVGCTASTKCPIWMYNYLKESTSYGGTINDNSSDNKYWTMSYIEDDSAYTMSRTIYDTGKFIGVWGANSSDIRAVITINK